MPGDWVAVKEFVKKTNARSGTVGLYLLCVKHFLDKGKEHSSYLLVQDGGFWGKGITDLGIYNYA